MAEMTDSQRRWEAWYAAYVRIEEAWPERIEVPCPDGDGGTVRIAFVADPGDERGMVFLWCDVCRTGISLHRVRVPDGAPRLPFDGDDEQFDAVVPPDVFLLPPDPRPVSRRTPGSGSG
jgi:hypothetical protein